jgi:putative signal transducing protein
MGDKLITVESFSTVMEAQLASGKLESSGIWATIFDENVINTNWMYSNALGGVKVKVREEDIAEAREILKIDSGEKEAKGETLGVCPRCGDNKIEYSFNKGGSILTWLALGIPLLPVKKRLRCRNCGNDWNPK